MTPKKIENCRGNQNKTTVLRQMAEFNTPLNKSLKRLRPRGDDAFKTPVMKRLQGSLPESPAFEIPPSPCLKQLGFGTGS